MTPPPSPDLPLGQRLAKLAQTLQFGWFTGHVVLLLCIVRYGFSYIRFNRYGATAQFSYRLAFIAAASTYGIVVYKTWRSRQKAIANPNANPNASPSARPASGVASYLAYIADENIQYMLMALLWLFMPQHPLAMLPYGIYSVFHVATYTRANLVPTFLPPTRISPAPGSSPGGGSPSASKPQYTQHPLSDTIGRFVKTYYDTSMLAVAALEILLEMQLVSLALLFYRRSWILFAIYSIFLRARFSQSTHIQGAFCYVEARVDHLLGTQGTPPMVRQCWEIVKNGVRTFYASTDLKRISGGTAPPKKSS